MGTLSEFQLFVLDYSSFNTSAKAIISRNLLVDKIFFLFYTFYIKRKFILDLGTKYRSPCLLLQRLSKYP